ncbi:Persulfide dioxygenase ETHE1 isoform 3 [Schistosoma japonicum]|uniref:Persulfide dioxygenase ETHE1, mitochondrial n=1 Tax=Schistosoma japonicum TaxID=6182 RepID=A0A4Z2D732_SCHJA|nr:Persulfide dioxygenase ETHE1, mitochondrial [Schistosoma japonicum]KAH8875916.1 Persulfide dioxygenase ETHE1, mitochondrial [Schistosoma japonicum]TNN12283.1 Persulfide dioxygenase ETHE1 isoform 3 [Schistosoma japonicum]
MTSKVPVIAAGCPLIFRQLFEKVSSTYTYLLADARTKDAIIIDPVLETVERDRKLISQLNLKLGPIINTHLHADHVTGSGLLKQIPGSFSMLSYYVGAKVDKIIKHGDFIRFGNFELECRSTPGHTVGCMTLVLHSAGIAFTGDALLIRGCGRTDFQGGSAEMLYDSVYSQIFSLPDNYSLFPAHDYVGNTMTTVGEEKTYNPRLTKSKTEFVKLMNELNLPPPKQIERAIPLNMKCGIVDE